MARKKRLNTAAVLGAECAAISGIADDSGSSFSTAAYVRLSKMCIRDRHILCMSDYSYILNYSFPLCFLYFFGVNFSFAFCLESIYTAITA